MREIEMPFCGARKSHLAVSKANTFSQKTFRRHAQKSRANGAALCSKLVKAAGRRIQRHSTFVIS
jgi:hypothetical protein